MFGLLQSNFVLAAADACFYLVCNSLKTSCGVGASWSLHCLSDRRLAIENATLSEALSSSKPNAWDAAPAELFEAEKSIFLGWTEISRSTSRPSSRIETSNFSGS